MNAKNLVVLIAAIVLASSGLLLAHHSIAGQYDRKNPVTVSGTVTEFLLINPHARIDFEVKDAQGNVVKWTAWSGPPAGMFRRGWKKDSLKPGDVITVTGSPAFDGSKQLSVQSLQPPDRSVPVLTLGAE
jgi:hypothetical protein